MASENMDEIREKLMDAEMADDPTDTAEYWANWKNEMMTDIAEVDAKLSNNVSKSSVPQEDWRSMILSDERVEGILASGDLKSLRAEAFIRFEIFLEFPSAETLESYFKLSPNGASLGDGVDLRSNKQLHAALDKCPEAKEVFRNYTNKHQILTEENFREYISRPSAEDLEDAKKFMALHSQQDVLSSIHKAQKGPQCCRPGH
jgi:hypothetical protein